MGRYGGSNGSETLEPGSLRVPQWAGTLLGALRYLGIMNLKGGRPFGPNEFRLRGAKSQYTEKKIIFSRKK